MPRLTFCIFLCALLIAVLSHTAALAQTNFVVDDYWVIDYRTPTIYYAGHNDRRDSPGSYQFVNPPSHGSVYWWDSFGTIGFNSYDLNYTGSDTLTYRYCYSVSGTQVCTNTATVIILIIGANDDSQNYGSCKVEKAAPSAPSNKGEPINVINGNMWLEHSDYSLPGIGEPIRINRFYNSSIQSSGYFGFGWTTDYDERLLVYDDKMLRLDMPDAKGVFFGRPNTSSPFLSVSRDVNAQVIKNQDNTYELTFQDGRKHKFDTGGRLLWQRDRNGNQTTLSYDANNRLVSLADAFGRTLHLIPNANGTIDKICDGTGADPCLTGEIARYTYVAGTNRLETVTYPDGSKYKYEYETKILGGQTKYYMSTAKDAIDKILEAHLYDAQGRAYTSEIEGGAEKYTFSFASDYTTVTDILGRTTRYDFTRKQGKNLVTRVEGSCACGGAGSETTVYQYDTWLNIVLKTDALGRQTTFEYFADGNVKKQIDVLGTQEFTYNGFGEVLKYRDRVDSQNPDPNVNTVTNTFDANGNLLTTKDALGNVTTLAYPPTNNKGLPDSIKDARNNVTKFKWFTTSGLLQEVEDTYGKKTYFTYEPRGRIDTITNTYGHVTDYNYFDDTQRKVEMIYPNQDKITYKFDIRRLPESTTDERGKITTYEFDPQYRLKKITDTLGHFKEFDYDLMSNMKLYKDPLGNITDYRYDDFDRLKEIEYPAATVGATRLKEKFVYDKIGRIKEYRDTADRLTSYNYDDINRTNTVTNAELETTTVKYNERLQMTEVKDAINQVYTFAYDPLGRVLSQTRAGGTMSFEYDQVGNRKKRTDYMGRVTNYTFDNLNRLTKIEYDHTNQTPKQQSTYGYDDISRLTSAINEAGSVTFGYDSRNRMTSTTDVFGRVIAYEYERSSTVNQKRLKLDGSLYATYNYDDAERLSNIINAADSTTISFGYYNDDLPQTRTYPNGVSTSYEFDNMRRLKRLTDTGPSGTLFDRQYAYNAANQISQIVEPSLSRVFGYDNVDRLTSVTGGATENYLFDDVGNRTSSHRSSTYGYQQGQFNRLTSTQTATYNFDANGNTTSKSEGSNFWRYTWDYENRMAEAATRKTKVRYRYDALGRRVARNLGGGRELTKFTYDGQDVLIDDNFGTLTKYLNGSGIDNKLRSTTSSTANYFLADHLGSTNALTNSTGTVTASNAYDSFGNPTNTSFSSRYQFTGREFDSFTGLQFSRARFYDPNLGRFMSEDPIGFHGNDINLYGYVNNGPISKSDPLGLWDLGYGAPRPSANVGPSFFGGPNDPIFGDGGYLSGPTIEEFFSAKERAKRKCKTTWGQRFKYNFAETNAALPGFGAPSIIPGIGMTSITSRATAGALGTLSPLQYALAGFRGATLAGVVGASAVNLGAVTLAYEGGVAAGSAINASFGFSDYCPCGQ